MNRPAKQDAKEGYRDDGQGDELDIEESLASRVCDVGLYICVSILWKTTIKEPT